MPSKKPTRLFFTVNAEAFPLETFSQPYFNWSFSNCFSQNIPAVQISFKKHDRDGFSKRDDDFGHLCCGRRIDMSPHSDFGIVSTFGASSIFCLSISKDCVCCLSCASLQSLYCVYYLCCRHLWCWWSLFSEYCRRSRNIFRSVSSKKNSILVFWCLASNSAFFKWQRSINEAKSTFLLLFLLHQPRQICFWLLFCPTQESFFPSLPTVAFAAGLFETVQQPFFLVVTLWTEQFSLAIDSSQNRSEAVFDGEVELR